MALIQKRLVSSISAIQATLSCRSGNRVDEQSTSTSLSKEASIYLNGEDLDGENKPPAEEEVSALTVTKSDAQFEEKIKMLHDVVSLAEGISIDSKAQKFRCVRPTSRGVLLTSTETVRSGG